jgi:hypothetical protein
MRYVRALGWLVGDFDESSSMRGSAGAMKRKGFGVEADSTQFLCWFDAHRLDARRRVNQLVIRPALQFVDILHYPVLHDQLLWHHSHTIDIMG